MFGSKKQNITLRDNAATGDSVAPTPGNKPLDPAAFPNIHAGLFGPKKDVQEQPNSALPPVQGQSAPDAKPTSFGGGGKKKQTTKLLILVVCIVVGVFGMLAMEILGNKQQSNDQGNTAQTTQAAQEAQALAEKKALEQKLALSESQNNEALSQMDQKIDEHLKKLFENNPNLLGGGAVSQDNSEIMQQLKTMSENQTKMQDQISKIGAAKAEELRKPKEGSSSPSILVNRMAEVKQTRQTEMAAAASADVSEPPFDLRYGIQSGAMIPAVLDTTIVSSANLDKYFVRATTTSPFEIMPGFVLPAGVKFLGRPTADYDSRRMIVNIEKLQYKNVELKLSGIMLDYRGNPGLVTKYIDPLNQAILPTMLTSFASAAATAAQDMTTSYNANTGEEYDRPTYSLSNAAWQGAAGGLSSLSNNIFNAYMKKKPVIIVKAGIPVYVQMSEKLLMEHLVESGVVQAER